MKIGIFSLPEISLGKHNIKDRRLDEIDKIVRAKKKTYVQVDLIGEENILDADVILASKDSASDLILKDLEFIETRLSRAEQEQEKTVLNKIKSILEEEKFIFNFGWSDEEKKLISVYGLLTNKPVVSVNKEVLSDLDAVLAACLNESGFISFFTSAGGNETRAWLVTRGATAWEAAGAIHSDIQKGFIRAEVISYEDFVALGGETAVKQAGKMRLEQKDYILQDAEIINFRFNK